jgi:flagellum-specific peptidoglycan hydrolase FlgJ
MATLNVEAWNAAKASQAKYGIPARVTYAQWALESGYGQHMPPGSNNPFGIKALPGQPFVSAMTREVTPKGDVLHIVQNFAKFEHLTAAFDAHAALLAHAGVYAKARAHENDPGAFADALTGIYATDPNYGHLLREIMAGLPS